MFRFSFHWILIRDKNISLLLKYKLYNIYRYNYYTLGILYYIICLASRRRSLTSHTAPGTYILNNNIIMTYRVTQCLYIVYILLYINGAEHHENVFKTLRLKVVTNP